MVELEAGAGIELAKAGVRPGERLAELLERRGRRVYEASGVWWANVDIDSRYFTSLPDQVSIEPRRDEVQALLHRAGGVVARYPSNRQVGLPCGAYVVQDRSYCLPKLQKRTRNFVRRGLESCQIRPVERKELLVQGLELNLATMARHGRSRPEFGDPKTWARTVEAVYSTRGSECWGAFVGDQMASYVMSCRDAGWEHLLIQMSRPELFKSYPNHAIDYFLIERAMSLPEVVGVCLGTLPLRISEGLHNYKIRMGYEVRPQDAVVVVHSLLEPLATSRLAGPLARQAGRFSQLAGLAERLEILAAGARMSSLEEDQAIAQELADWVRRRTVVAGEGESDV
ncbi:MAG: hypothetical protein K2X03_17730 [Bryobacteraceae bacterium]|nr:hypothetical protein [Bryobacteraceae bacterium]